MGQRKEALRAATLAGPRAALTRWGVEGVPEGGKKHGLGVDDHPQPPAQAQAQWGHEALPDRWMASCNETSRKLVRKCPRFPLDIATYRWAVMTFPNGMAFQSPERESVEGDSLRLPLSHWRS
jgi:hypothetical protein